MPNAISKDLKEQILSRVWEGKTTVVEIASQHGVKVNTVYNWVSKSLHGNNGSTLRESRLQSVKYPIFRSVCLAFDNN